MTGVQTCALPIFPGRDGLVHISKLGKGQRVNNVEDVLELGQEIEVRVDDIDDKGKVSLTPVGEGYENVEHTGERREHSDRGGRDRDRGGRDRDRGGRDRDRGPRDRNDRDRGPRDRDDRDGGRRERGSSDGIVEVSFEDEFDNEIAGELGDLGPGGRAGGDDRDRGDRGDRNRRRR